MNNIIFILPPDNDNPIGGYKIVYEYANRLVKRGWSVSIGYDCRGVGQNYSLYKCIKKYLIKLISKYRCSFYPRWFSLSPDVEKFCIYKDKDVPLCDYLVATAYATASLVSKQAARKKIYFIQGFEAWDGRTVNEIKESYRLGMENIVIAKWLKQIVDESCGSDNSTIIPNGIDMQEFSVDIPPEKRNVKRICMLYHQGEYKGSKYGIQVLLELKKIYPDLQAILFGVPERPKGLPAWIEYIQNASSVQLRKIYNDSQVFLYPALAEGFGLTCVESMACGCALCVTDYLGAHEFAMAGQNALISPVKDVGTMVKNACKLLEDTDVRCRLARQGMAKAKEFNWDTTIDAFEKKLRQISE